MRFLIFLLTVFYTSLTFAQGIQYTDTTDKWVFEKNYHDDNKTLDHCLIKNRYDNGTVLILATNPNELYRLALHFPHTNLTVNKSYKVDLMVDERPLVTSQAIVATPSLLAIALPPQKSVINELARGNTFDIVGPKDIVRFTLKGTANAIKKLNSCIGKKENSLEKPTQEMPRLPKWLDEILVKIDMIKIRTIAINNNQNLPLDYAWVTPDVFGGVKLIPYDKNQTTPEIIISHYIKTIERLCVGDFLSDTSDEKKNQTTLFKPYDIICSNEKDDAITSLLFGIEDDLVTVFFFEGDSKGIALEKRNSILDLMTQ